MVKNGILVFWVVLGWLLGIGLSWSYQFPDTGQTKCYDNEKEILCPKPGEPLYGQDAQYSGPQPAYKDNGDGTVTDLNTGLMWQQGDSQNEFGRSRWQEACDYCASFTLPSGGYSDWRLPDRRELMSIALYGQSNPCTNTTYFPNCRSSGYWSGTLLSPSSIRAWVVCFSSGSVSPILAREDYSEYIRCVRGEPIPTPILHDNGNGTVSDSVTQLMWQQGDTQNSSGRTWEGALDYCESLNLSGYSDWRLPNIRELESIVDFDRYDPAINAAYFPNCLANGYRYWSSSTIDSSLRLAWQLNFYNGTITNSNSKDECQYIDVVRCVRGGKFVPVTIPSVTTDAITLITATSATSGGNVIYDGGSQVTSRGVCWSTSANPTIDDNIISAGSGTGKFSAPITGLQPKSEYHVRAYATNNVGPAYGEDMVLNTAGEYSSADVPINILDYVKVVSDLIISESGAVESIRVKLNITHGYDSDLDVYLIGPDGTRVELFTDVGGSGEHFTDTILDDDAELGIAEGSAPFSGTYRPEGNLSVLTGKPVAGTWLMEITDNVPSGGGTGTLNAWSLLVVVSYKVLPEVTTEPVTSITSTSAASGGIVVSDGGAAVEARGVCWSTSAKPTTANNKTSNGSGTGGFASSMTGLAPGMTYHVRAYAINRFGMAYGNDLAFITSPTLPTVTTSEIHTIGKTSAKSGGDVVSDGGADVAVRGVCWSTSKNPTVSDPHTSNGTGEGSFISQVTGLTPGTEYYLCAYATNSQGTGYGSDIAFITVPSALFYTDPNGSCAGHQPCYSTIQGAIDGAADGDTILVCHGDYPEAIVMDEPKSLTLLCGRNDDFSPSTFLSTAHELQINRGTLIVEGLSLSGD